MAKPENVLSRPSRRGATASEVAVAIGDIERLTSEVATLRLGWPEMRRENKELRARVAELEGRLEYWIPGPNAGIPKRTPNAEG